MLRGVKNDTIVVSVPSTSANLGRLLRRVEDEGRSLVIEERGTPKAVLLSIRDYVRLAAPEPEVLRVIGQESQQFLGLCPLGHLVDDNIFLSSSSGFCLIFR